jgi:hypothetical protein
MEMAKDEQQAPETPRYQHDCDDCVFLGCDASFDLYWHPSGNPEMRTVIARFGNEGPEYHSGMAFAAPYMDITGAIQMGIAPLVKAKRRAIERGLTA